MSCVKSHKKLMHKIWVYIDLSHNFYLKNTHYEFFLLSLFFSKVTHKHFKKASTVTSHLINSKKLYVNIIFTKFFLN